MAELKIDISDLEVIGIKLTGLKTVIIEFIIKRKHEMNFVGTVGSADGYIIVEGEEKDLRILANEVKDFFQQIAIMFNKKAENL